MKMKGVNLTLPKYKLAIGSFLITLVLMASFAIRPVVAEEQPQSTETSFQNVTVNIAYDMITNGALPELVVLDVRYQCEYDIGHLDNAVLIPYDELETRIGEFVEHRNHEIIVYCRSGYRSQIACEILVEYDFTKVFNMLGGILGWIDAGFPISTTSPVNRILTVTPRDHGIPLYELMDFASFRLSQAAICPSTCSTCPTSSDTCDTSLVIEGNTVTVMADDTEVVSLSVENFEILLDVSELNDEFERKTMLMQMGLHVVENGGIEGSFTLYGLMRGVTAFDFSVIIITMISVCPLGNYVSFSTLMNYAPAEGKDMFYGDAIIINSSVTLSEHYDLISKSLRFLKAHVYQGESELAIMMSKAYIGLASELQHLSKFVQGNLADYNAQTTLMGSSALAFDSICTYECGLVCDVIGGTACIVACGIIAAACGPFYPICFAACMIGCGAGIGAFCVWLCNTLCGEETTIYELGCGAVCGSICVWCPEGNPICLVCGWSCEQVCNSIFG